MSEKMAGSGKQVHCTMCDTDRDELYERVRLAHWITQVKGHHRGRAQGPRISQLPLGELLQQAIDAGTIEKIAEVCGKLQLNRGLPEQDRAAFNDCFEEADILLERKDRLAQHLYELALSIQHRDREH